MVTPSPVAVEVAARVAATERERARLLGFAFGATFLLALVADLPTVGTLRGHGFMVAQLLLALAVPALVRTPLGERHASTVFGACMVGVSAAGAAHVSQFGGLEGPYFYGSYTAPPTMIPMLFPLWRRIGWTTANVGAFVAVYLWQRPGLFDVPMGHIPLVYLVTISFISVVLGHHVRRLETGSFTDVVRLTGAAAALEGQLALEAQAPQRVRDAVARQLHDDVAQLLTGARVQLGRGKGDADVVGRVAELLDQLALRSRRMLEDLRAPTTAGPFAPALFALRDAYVVLGLAVEVVVDDAAAAAVDGRADLRDALVSCAKEGLTNAVRHGGAKSATVNVGVVDGDLVLAVYDDGVGVDDVVEGHGLRGVRERAEALGGRATLTRGDVGAILRVSVPLHRAGAAPQP